MLLKSNHLTAQFWWGSVSGCAGSTGNCSGNLVARSGTEVAWRTPLDSALPKTLLLLASSTYRSNTRRGLTPAVLLLSVLEREDSGNPSALFSSTLRTMERPSDPGRRVRPRYLVPVPKLFQPAQLDVNFPGLPPTICAPRAPPTCLRIHWQKGIRRLRCKAQHEAVVQGGTLSSRKEAAFWKFGQQTPCSLSRPEKPVPLAARPPELLTKASAASSHRRSYIGISTQH